MIRLENITKHYSGQRHEIHALKNINLTVKQGEIFGVVGRSGAGKSTLLRCVNLLERPTSGAVFIGNNELTAMSSKQLRVERRKIGMIFQHFNLLESRTVYDNIAFPLELAGTKKTDIQQRITDLLHLTGLSDKALQYPSQLSGGQKQRVAIARALATEPDVLLSDEATSALDPETTAAILNLLREINQRLNLTILLITHQMEVVKQICDQVAVIDQGEIIEQGPIKHFFGKPKTQIAKNLVKTTLKEELPLALQQRISTVPLANHFPLLRIFFHGANTSKPLIAHLIKELNIEINILQANIEVIHDDTIGIMIVEAIADEAQIKQAMAYLSKNEITVEVIGYVSRTIE